MMDLFETALAHVLKWEGGEKYTNDPRDPGGETKFGIAKRSHPDVNIAALTHEQAADIYRDEYWNICRCDALPAPLAFMVFDTAVNQGVAFAIKTLQRALGVTADGHLGPQTLVAVKAANVSAVLRDYAARRMYHYMLLDDLDDTYGLGWSRRIIDTTLVASGVA